MQTGSQTIRKVLGEAYPNFDIIDCDSIVECLDSVRSGKSDLMMQNQYVVEYLISKPIYEKLKVIPVLGLDDMLCFSAVYSFDERPGPTVEDGEILIGILDKAIAALTEDEIGSYTIKAISDYKYTYTFSDFVYRYRMAMTILTVAVIVIIILVVFIMRQHVRIMEDKANSKVKGRFLSTMSHEIRTPLNGLVGLNHLMSQNINDPEQLRSYLSQSSVMEKYLLSLVNDMLDMASIQSQDMTLDVQPLDLGLLIKTVDSVTSVSMEEKKLRYRLESDIDSPYIAGDAARIQQVIFNLLDNARKFTPKGGMVKMSVSQKMLDSGRILTSVVVSDTGRGMSEEFQKHIFETFAQELDTVSKGNQGTGLGLPICRRLARLMGGDITFVSRKNDGSTFTFTFEAEAAEITGSAPKKEAITGSNRPRVLVAEDNELNGEIIMELLQEEGFEAHLTENGRDALSEFESSEPGTYGVILMDLLMPVMDGFEAAEAIRALDRSDAKTVKIFACTANCSPEDRDKALLSGMDDFITKPIDVDVLISKLSE